MKATCDIFHVDSGRKSLESPIWDFLLLKESKSWKQWSSSSVASKNRALRSPSDDPRDLVIKDQLVLDFLSAFISVCQEELTNWVNLLLLQLLISRSVISGLTGCGMKKILYTCVSVVSLSIVLLIVMKMAVEVLFFKDSLLTMKDRISFRSKMWISNETLFTNLSLVECKEYKKMTESNYHYRGFALHSEEDNDSNDASYNCPSHEPFVSGGMDVKDNEYLHMAGKNTF